MSRTGLPAYVPTAADRAPMPASYADEPRHLGYADADQARPYASFFAEQPRPVAGHVRDALLEGMAPTERGHDLRDVATRLQRPGHEALETGWTRVGARTYVAVHTPMPGVTAAMWDWWFGWHGRETARYKLWHPGAHQFSAVGEDRGADRTLTDRQRYVGNVSYVDEYIGRRLLRLAIRFVDPASLGFEDRPGTTHVCARVGYSDKPLSFGWLVHQVRPTDDGAEMRSRFFLNAPALLDRRRGELPLPGRLTAPALPASIGADMVHHCATEMHHLAGFLPALHEAFAGAP